jgi:hypothetical protein
MLPKSHLGDSEPSSARPSKPRINNKVAAPNNNIGGVVSPIRVMMPNETFRSFIGGFSGGG